MTKWYEIADLQKVRGTIIGLSGEIKNARKQFKKAKKEYKDTIKYRAGFLANECRHYNLVYAFARGKKYFQLERNCSEKPDIEFLLDIVGRYGHLYGSIAKWTPTSTKESRDSEVKSKLISWLKGEDSNA
jgi:hypothetical protein